MFTFGFIYVVGGLDPKVHRTEVKAQDSTLYVIGVSNYAEAEEAAKELVAKGASAIELCAGFGYEGIARIKKAVGEGISVGAVKFDYHPALGWKSGDDVFQ